MILLFCLLLSYFFVYIFFIIFIIFLIVLFFPLVNFNEFGYIKTIHVMHMRVNSSRFSQVNMESLLNKLCQTLFTNLNSTINNFDKSSLKSVINNFFILQRRN